MLDFDTMLVHVGEFGRYQKMLFLFQAPFCIFVTFVTFGSLFMQISPPEFFCQDRFNCSQFSYLTPGQKQNLSFPYTQGGVDACYVVDINKTFMDEISQGQRRANKEICINTEEASRRPANGNNQVRQSCVHVFNGTFWYSDPLDATGYRNYKPGNNWNGNSGQNIGPSSNRMTRQSSYYSSGNRRLPYSTTEDPNYIRYTNSFANKRTTTDYYGSGSNGESNNNRNWGSGNNGWNSNGQPTVNPNYYPQSPGNGQEFPRPDTYPQSGNTGRPGYDPQNRNPQSGTSGPNQPWESDRDRDDKKQKPQWHNNCDRTTLLNFELKNTTRLVLENVVMSSKGGQGTPQNTFTPRGGDHKICNAVGWERRTPGNNHRFYPTIVTEGNWWCNLDTYDVASQSIFFIGAIVGGVLIGWVADTWGRVPALVIANLIGAVGGALSVISANFWIYSFFRFITGMCFDNCFVMMYILVLEFCGPSYRTIVANLSIAIFYTIGTVILPWLALYLANWRTFGLVISLPMLLGLVALFIVPESSRWLLSKGKAKQATNILRRFAKVNGKHVDESIFVEFEEGAQKLYDEISQEEEDPSISEAFKTPRLRKTFILLILIWSSIAVVYDGHNRNVLNLANDEWNIYWMFTFGSLTEFPADILLILTLDRFGRRWLAFASLTLSGVCSFIAATVPRDQWLATFIMAMMSRFWVNVSFNIGLQYASELLPTVIRAQGVNIIHIMGYVASIVSPFIARIGRTQPVLSLLLLGAIACFGGILSLFLAETLGEDLPNNLEEAEAFGKHQSFWNCPICAKPKPVEEEKVIEVPEAVRLRNSLFRASTRGENRSSIISNRSRNRGLGIGLDPFPSETTQLQKNKRYTH